MAAPTDNELGMEEPNKSQRKKEREKRRREEIGRAFNDLQTILVSIDPESAADTNPISNKRRRRRSSIGDDDADTSVMTRLDLIHRTIGVLRKLQRENSELRRRLNESGATGGDKEVLVMVPTLSPVESPQDTAGSAASPAPQPPSAISQRAVSYPSYQYQPQPPPAGAPVAYATHPDSYQTYYASAPPPQHSAYHSYSPSASSGGGGGGGWSSQGPPQHYPPPSQHHAYAYLPSGTGSSSPQQQQQGRPPSSGESPPQPQPDPRRDREG